MKKNLSLVFNRSELGAGTRGSSLGIDSILIEASKRMKSFFIETPSIKISDKNQFLFKETKYKWAKYAGPLIDVYKDISEKIENQLANNKYPIIFSGDHSNAYGSICGLKKFYPNEDLGIIWIDAHADLHSPYTTPSGNIHGMPLAMALNEDNFKFEIGDVDDETVKVWDQLKKINNVFPKIKPSNIIYIGLRDTEKEEDYLIKKHNINIFNPLKVRSLGVKNMVKTIKNDMLKKCKHVYVSFDVDSLDSEKVSSGTGTPIKNGLLIDECKIMLRSFYEWDKSRCLEITEINPLLDKKNKMTKSIFDILEYVLNI